MEYFPATLDSAASDAGVRRWREQIAQRGWGLWATELRASGEFIGFIGLQVPAAPLPFAPCVEIGWRLAPAHWGHGYATEGGRAALEFGFERLRLDEIVDFTAVGNTRSRGVMTRLRMLEEPTLFEHPGVPEGSPVRTHCWYRLRSAAQAPGFRAMQLVRPAEPHLASYAAAGWCAARAWHGSN